MSISQIFPLLDTDTEDVETVRRDIYFLSSLFSGRGWTDVGPNPPDPGKKFLDQLSIWRSIAFVLNSGSPDQSRAVAVTGRFTAGRIEATVVIENRTKLEQDSNSDNKSRSLKSFPLKDDEETRDLMNNELSDVDFDTHLIDVVSLFNYFLIPRNLHGKEEEHLLQGRIIGFFRFIIQRGYRKFSSRLSDGSKIWGNGERKDHPLRLLENYLSRNVQDFPPRNFTFAQNDQWLEYLNIYDLIPNNTNSSSQENTFTIKAENIHQWAKALLGCLDDLESLPSEDSEGETRPKPPKCLDSIGKIYAAMFRLKRFMSCGIGEFLLQFFGWVTYTELGHPDHLRGPSPQQDMSSDLIERDEDVVRWDTPVDYGGHAKRYLKSLYAPLDAALLLVFGASKLSQAGFLSPENPCKLEVHALDIEPPSSGVDISSPILFTRFQSKFMDGLSWRESRLDAQDFFDALDPAKSPSGCVHAEAALMTLAYNRTIHPEGTPWFPIWHGIPESPIPIGTSDKCCLCCLFLCESLEQTSRKNIRKTPTAKDCRFYLSGTHNTIFPWIAPANFRNIEKLKYIRGKLMDAIRSIFSHYSERKARALEIENAREYDSYVFGGPWE